MNCKEIQDLFTDFLGNELPEGLASAFKQHIKDCPPCRNELASLTKTCSLLRDGWPEEPIPQHLVFDLPGSTSRSIWQSWWRPGMPRFAMASLVFTACLILCAGGLSLFRTQVRIGPGGVQISFGQSVQTPIQPAAATPVRLEADARELQFLVDRVLQQVRQKQDQRLEAALLQLRADFQERREVDMRRIANELRQLESSQNVVYRQAVSSNTYLETLARDYFVKANSPVQTVH